MVHAPCTDRRGLRCLHSCFVLGLVGRGASFQYRSGHRLLYSLCGFPVTPCKVRNFVSNYFTTGSFPHLFKIIIHEHSRHLLTTCDSQTGLYRPLRAVGLPRGALEPELLTICDFQTGLYRPLRAVGLLRGALEPELLTICDSQTGL
jgi:hypothetical protein